MLPQTDLKDTPYNDSDITMYVDGLSRKNPDGTNATGYAVVTVTLQVLQVKPLPKNYSGQGAELIALTEACKLAKGKILTANMPSQLCMCLPNNGKIGVWLLKQENILTTRISYSPT